jgi:hypothetical protein
LGNLRSTNDDDDDDDALGGSPERVLVLLMVFCCAGSADTCRCGCRGGAASVLRDADTCRCGCLGGTDMSTAISTAIPPVIVMQMVVSSVSEDSERCECCLQDSAASLTEMMGADRGVADPLLRVEDRRRPPPPPWELLDMDVDMVCYGMVCYGMVWYGI